NRIDPEMGLRSNRLRHPMSADRMIEGEEAEQERNGHEPALPERAGSAEPDSESHEEEPVGTNPYAGAPDEHRGELLTACIGEHPKRDEKQIERDFHPRQGSPNERGRGRKQDPREERDAAASRKEFSDGLIDRKGGAGLA